MESNLPRNAGRSRGKIKMSEKKIEQEKEQEKFDPPLFNGTEEDQSEGNRRWKRLVSGVDNGGAG